MSEQGRDVAASTGDRADSIDAAWAEVVATLPEGWIFELTQESDHCEAVALDAWREPQLLTRADAPTAALRALALQLRDLTGPR